MKRAQRLLVRSLGFSRLRKSAEICGTPVSHRRAYLRNLFYDSRITAERFVLSEATSFSWAAFTSASVNVRSALR